MNDEFCHKFEESQLAEIIQSLNESFSTFDDAERHITSTALFGTKMRETTSVTDHMMEKFKKLARLGFPVQDHLHGLTAPWRHTGNGGSFRLWSPM